MKTVKTLLFNHVTYRPVGHVVEALKISNSLFRLNPDIEITLLLNDQTPVELAKGCPWLKEVIGIDTYEVEKKGVQADIFSKLNSSWDYILDDTRVLVEYTEDGYNEEMNLIQYIEASQKYFTANKWRGNVWAFNQYPQSLKFQNNMKINIPIPSNSIKFVEDNWKFNYPIKIGLLMAGSSRFSDYPSIDSWIRIITAINNKYPDCHIYLTGVSKSINGRTNTSNYSNQDILDINSQFLNMDNCYDIGIWNQIALISKCDLFVSPHSGFSFLAPCVNTPWLSLSWKYSEYFFNQVTFYSVLPICTEYPCYRFPKEFIIQECLDREKLGKQIVCMDTRELEAKIPDILKGIELLLDKDFSFETALKLHKRKANGRWNFESPFI